MSGEPKDLCWSFVNVDKHMNSDKTVERFLLHAEKRGRTLIAFMMNPSYAGIENKEISDQTVNMLLRTLGSNYEDVYIINNIPIKESQSTNLCEGTIKKCNFEHNEETIKKLVSELDGYDLYVGVGVKGSGGGFSANTNSKIRTSYIKNMNILCDNVKCKNIYTSGLNSNGVSQHPKPQKMSTDVAEFLLNSKRKTNWNSKACKLERI